MKIIIKTDPELNRLSQNFDRTSVNNIYRKHYPCTYQQDHAYEPWQYISMLLVMIHKKMPSFRNLHTELNIKANAHLRQFCGLRFGHVPARSRLQAFIQTLTSEIWDDIMNLLWGKLISKFPEIQELPLVVGIDTTDQPVNSSYDKKTETFSDTDATFGYRTSKLGKTKTFGGYKKHAFKALYPTLGLVLPIYSRVETAKLKENIPMVDYYRLLEKFPLFDKQKGALGLGDVAYVDGARQKRMRELLNITFITGIRSNTKIDSSIYDKDGHPTCPEGYRLIWRGKSACGSCHEYDGDAQYCAGCPLSDSCDKQFELEVDLHEILLGNIPYHKTKDIRKRLRPQIEITNYWDKHVCLDTVRFKRNKHLTSTLARSYDVYKLVRYMSEGISAYRKKRRTPLPRVEQLSLLLAA